MTGNGPCPLRQPPSAKTHFRPFRTSFQLTNFDQSFMQTDRRISGGAWRGRNRLKWDVAAGRRHDRERLVKPESAVPGLIPASHFQSFVSVALRGA
jgi:hypothetical protein